MKRQTCLRLAVAGSLITVPVWTSAIAIQSQSSAAVPSATATIIGVVVDQHSRIPVRSAVVRLNQPDGRGLSRTVTADDDGRFAFGDLPGGEYMLSSSRTGYLFTTLGEQRPGGPGLPVKISEGETRDDIVIPMSRGGVISGRVVDDHAEPAPAVQVNALQYRFEAGKRVLRPVFSDRTDDRGEYRLFMLPSGEYFVSAEPNPLPMRIPDALIGMASRAAPNLFPGTVATFYPDSATPSRARSVTVVEGRETSRVNITLVAGKLARVRGRAVTASGEPFARAVVSIQSRVGSMMPRIVSSLAREDGSFELADVAPGEYVVTVRPIGGDDDSETARLDITITGANVDDLVLVGSRGASLRGTITTETGDPVPLQATQLVVRLLPAPQDRGGPTIPLTVQPNFAFDARSVLGSYRVTADVTGPVGLWALKTIRWRGEDVTNRTFDFRPGDVIDQIEIVLSDRWATLSGVLRDESGTPASDAPLVLFPVDEALWIPGGRYIRGMRTDYQGRYGISWLLPGEYLLAAPKAMELDQWNDPAFLRSLVDHAARVTLSEEDDRVVDLRVRRN